MYLQLTDQKEPINYYQYVKQLLKVQPIFQCIMITGDKKIPRYLE